MYRQFALVIAATALISGGQRVDVEADAVRVVAEGAGSGGRRRTWFFRWFNAVYEPLERRYVRVIRFMVERSGRMAAIALVLIALAGWGLTQVPTGFLPTEDQGYLMVAVQMPDGASLERTQNVMDRISHDRPRRLPARRTRSRSARAAPRRSTATCRSPTPGIVYLMLKNWSERGRGEDLDGDRRRTSPGSSPPCRRRGPASSCRRRSRGSARRTASRCRSRLTDGSYDFERLQRVTDEIVREANAVAGGPGRLHGVPRVGAAGDRATSTRRRRRRCNVNVGDVYNTVQIYLGSSFVNLFTRFGHNYMVYLQADPLRRLNVRRRQGPLRAQPGRQHGARRARWPTSGRRWGPRSSRSTTCFPRRRSTACRPTGCSSGQALAAMEKIAKQTLPRGMASSGPRCPTRSGSSAAPPTSSSPSSILLVYFVLCGPVRELDHAGRRHPGGADGAARHGRRAAGASASRTTSTCRSAWCCSSRSRPRTPS